VVPELATSRLGDFACVCASAGDCAPVVADVRDRQMMVNTFFMAVSWWRDETAFARRHRLDAGDRQLLVDGECFAVRRIRSGGVQRTAGHRSPVDST
jgi:hypothetical protein